jgi:DNA-binding ferritin-like protein
MAKDSRLEGYLKQLKDLTVNIDKEIKSAINQTDENTDNQTVEYLKDMDKISENFKKKNK